jgi:hypothetical protein
LRKDNKKIFDSKLLFVLVAFFAFSLSCCLHFYKLDSIPSGFFTDECGIGYNAYCISETGADEYGIKYPLFFRNFDNYQEPIMVYFLVPLVKVFGLSKFVIRFASAFFCILASLAFFFLARRISRNKWIALTGAFVFSCLPWVFPLSRSSMAGYMPMLFGICIGWYFMLQAFGRRSNIFSVLSALGWAFGMYAHNCGRPMIPVILICFVLAFNILLIKRWKIFLTFCLSFFLSMLPMILYAFWHPEFLTSRFNQISIWGDSPAVGELIKRIIVRYIGYFSPSFLVVSGDSILRHNIGCGGELYLFMIPFIFIGGYYVFKSFKKNPWSRFILFCILTYPLAAVFTMGRMHATRSLNGVPFWCALGILGASCVWRRRRKLYLLFLVVAFLAVYELGQYFYHFYRVYPKISRQFFYASFVDALEALSFRVKDGDKVYISPYAVPLSCDKNFRPMGYAYLLFFLKVSPCAYQREGRIPGVSLYEWNTRAGGGILLRINPWIANLKDGSRILVPNKGHLPRGAQLLDRIEIAPNLYYEILRVPDETKK